MPKQLFLLRHAKSSWDDPTLADHDRPLSKRGRKAGAALRRLFQSERINPDLVLISSALRTLQTLAALGAWEKTPKLEVAPSLYHAPAPQIIDLLRKIPDSAPAVLLIGHNPGLQDLALLLMGEQEDAQARRLKESYPTGALAEFALDGPWLQIDQGSGRLTRFVTPRELK
jgi:phosphohistidine phosphatase